MEYHPVPPYVTTRLITNIIPTMGTCLGATIPINTKPKYMHGILQCINKHIRKTQIDIYILIDMF